MLLFTDMRLHRAWLLLMTLFLFPSTSLSVQPASERLEVLVDKFKEEPAEELEQESKGWFPNAPERDQERYSVFKLGLIYYKNKKWNKAQDAFQKLLVIYPEFSDYALYHLGDIKLEKQEYKDALNYFSSLIKDYPKSIWIEEATFKIAQTYFAIRSFGEGIKAYETYLENYPHGNFRPLAAYRRGVCLEELKEDKRAVEEYKSVWISYPNAEFASELNDRLERFYSQPSFKNAQPTPQESFERTMIFFKDQNFTRALSELQALEKGLKDSKDTEFVDRIKLQIVRTQMRLRDYGQALEILTDLKLRHRNSMIFSLIARAYQGMGKEDDALNFYSQIITIFPGSADTSIALFTIGTIHLRRAEYDKAIQYFKNFSKTYKHDSTNQSAYWLLGWSYFLKGDFESALPVFREFSQTKDEDSLKIRYWQAKTLFKLGKEQETREVLESIISNNPLSYYALVSEQLLRQIAPERTIASIISERESTKPTTELKKKDVEEEPVSPLLTNKNYQKAEILIRIGLTEYANKELKLADKETENKSLQMLGHFAPAYQAVGNYYRPLFLAVTTFSSQLSVPITEANRKWWEYAYPLAFWDDVKEFSKKYGVDPFIVLSLMRAESHFQTDVVSPTGAVGLMQIMPLTATHIALKLKTKDFDFQEMQSPRRNIQFGTWYVKHLMDQFNNFPTLAIPSYNAGPHRVKSWIKDRNGLPLDEFVEKIPYPETRNYIKRVLQNYWTYILLYKKTYESGIPSEITYKVQSPLPPQEEWSNASKTD